MQNFKYIFFFLLFCSFACIAQPNQGVAMADAMRSNGKIYVVVAVILTLFAGIVFYLVRLDKKISQLEREED